MSDNLAMDEKKEHLGGSVTPTSVETASASMGFDEKQTRALIRKLDWNLVPFLALLYLYA